MTDLSRPRPACGSVRGVLLATLAFALFTGMDCTVKAMSARLHVFEIVWIQTIVMLVALFATALARGGLGRLRTRRPLPHLLRGALLVASLTLTFTSYGRLPLAEVYGVMFTVPLLVTALGVPLLGEHVGRQQWAAVLAGFAGVMVMTAPLGHPFGGLDMLLPLAGALSNALGFLLVRKMQATETTESIGIFGNLAVLVAMTPMLPGVRSGAVGRGLFARHRRRPAGHRRLRRAGARQSCGACRPGGAVPIHADALGGARRPRYLRSAAGRTDHGGGADRRGKRRLHRLSGRSPQGWHRPICRRPSRPSRPSMARVRSDRRGNRRRSSPWPKGGGHAARPRRCPARRS